MPDITALEAAINPEANDFIYFLRWVLNVLISRICSYIERTQCGKNIYRLD
jgi:hypothetical protein